MIGYKKAKIFEKFTRSDIVLALSPPEKCQVLLVQNWLISQDFQILKNARKKNSKF
jgi:hypothetical protein